MIRFLLPLFAGLVVGLASAAAQVRVTVHYHVTPRDGRAEYEWAADKIEEVYNDYFSNRTRFEIHVVDVARDSWGRPVSGIYAGRNRAYVSDRYIGNRAGKWKLGMHETMHKFAPYHHASPGLLGRGGVAIHTITAADWTAITRGGLRVKAGRPRPWVDPKNKPDVTNDEVEIDPGVVTLVDVLANDRSPRGFALALHGNQATSNNAKVQASGYNQQIRVVAADGFGAATIKFQVRNEIGSDSAVWSELTVRERKPTFSWTNEANPADVNDDGRVSYLDVLVIVNHTGQPVDESRPLVGSHGEQIYPDANGDGRVSSLDWLFVINRMGN